MRIKDRPLRYKFAGERPGYLLLVDKVHIVDFCQAPSEALERRVAQLLKYFDAADLEGLSAIFLIDKATEPRPSDPEWYKQAVSAGLWFQGWYAPATATHAATIVLHMAAVLNGLPPSFMRTPAASASIMAILAIEVGHHVLRFSGTRFSDSGEEQRAAIDYSRRIIKMVRKKLRFRVGIWLRRQAGDYWFVSGMRSWRKGDYEGAALDLAKATHLGTTRADSQPGYWYKRASEMAGHTVPSIFGPVTDGIESSPRQPASPPNGSEASTHCGEPGRTRD
ncbi:MAG TPA: hypothetical protein VJX67_07775 [Blastocatellia bacterium]|nr:hypothetical protein [Blastocatellia bacterium]